MSSPTANRPNKNWLLIKFRQWHSWGGLFLSVFILIVAVTGILLNHKDALLHAEKKKGPTGALTSTTKFDSLPVGFERALAIAHSHFGNVSLEKIELKDEHGRLVYKVNRGHGEEIWIDSQTGEASSKYGISLAATGTTKFNWAKIVDDLHTGKIFGSLGKLTVDFTSGVIIALTLTGIYLWGMPLIRKRQNAQNRQATATRRPPRPTPTPVEVA